MNKVIYITPIFNFYFDEQEKPLTHAFAHKGLTYNIIIERIPYYCLKRDELVLEMDQPTQEQYRRITKLNYSFGQTDAKLRVRISTESVEKLDYIIHFVNIAFLTAISLYSSHGVLYDSKLRIEYSDGALSNNMIYSGIRKQNPDRSEGEASILKVSDFADSIKSFEIFLKEEYKENKIFNNILKLSLNYHALLFENWYIPTNYLLLMIIFEALFKKEDEKYISEAAKIFAKLVEQDSEKREIIINDFWNEKDRNDIKSFSVLRNKIAHGDPNFTVEMLAGRYKILYKYVVQGLIKVLHIPNEQIGANDNYYDKLKQITNHEV